ncbi:N-glycosylase/DNA lyase OGG1 isoform X2 [Manihot esculenta]|uniref:DNA-(apurinic or apyrimidinic site) lyase n=1 Tax=Manihot esculenta TaxID=3983 RepID=A0A251LJ00_MANES|nr:N-glycosylase/DNA lyase OGG1 isoform X2 [Manihot esculenta]
MKRPRSEIPLSAASRSPPSLPHTPPQRLLKPHNCKATSQISSKKHKNSILKVAAAAGKTTHLATWAPLDLTQSELSLPLTFPTGQTFRWKQTGPLQYTGTLGPHLISLKHHNQNGDVYYRIHRTPSESAAKSALLDFLNIDISLTDIWAEFSASDSRFAELARHLKGARVLRQDPLECLIQFLCSSNNNIARITKMVDFISSSGEHLGSVGGFEFHEFPSLERLAMATEQELREAGFGYRAKYVTGTVDALQLKPGGGAEWLASLRKLDLQVVIDALCTLPGVGPKVAACIALFSLDQHHAIPVDTHVWQIATRYLLPELAGARLTPKLCGQVANAFVSKYGKYAGWAQTLLFIAELPAQKTILPSQFATNKEIKPAVEKDSEVDDDP